MSVAVASCGVDPAHDDDETGATATALAPSVEARGRIEALRERFHTTVRHERPATRRESPALGRPDVDAAAVLGAGVATAFVPSSAEGATVRALVPREAKRGIARTASVELPVVATGFARLVDDASQLSVRFALQGVRDAPIAVADGIAVYAGAFPRADIVHRVHAEGTEDFVVFEERPAREELRYAVDVSRVAGLRLVGNTLEFLDEAGTPRLRVAPPYVVDAHRERRAATLTLEGCAHDVNPAAPWGRPVTDPRAAQCTLLVAWAGVTYPAVVDPAWTATGSMSVARSSHTASVLASGRVLIVGGQGQCPNGGCFLTAVEVYDPTTGTFAVTDSLSVARPGHTATVLPSDKVLVVGGFGHLYPPIATAELYDPAVGTFSATGTMTVARGGHRASMLASGEVLVTGGGLDGPSSAELYNPTTATFSATGSMAEARSGHTASVLASGKVLVLGGSTASGQYHESAELYDPVAGTFAATGSMAQARPGPVASVLQSGEVLVVGGGTPGVLASAEVYDPLTGTFSPTGSLTMGRFFGLSASLLQSGQVLVAGGCPGPTSEQALATAELYDPSTGTFSTTPSMELERSGHSASVLGSGEVIVVGGRVGPFSAHAVLSSAELYGDANASGGGSGTGGSTAVVGTGAGGSPAVGGAGAGGSSPVGGEGAGGSRPAGGAGSDSGGDGGCGCATGSRASPHSLVASLGLLLMTLARGRAGRRATAVRETGDRSAAQAVLGSGGSSSSASPRRRSFHLM